MDGLNASNGFSASSATVDYLQLLTVQLQNQDPIDPVDQEGMINDLTQFSILQGIEDLNESFDEVLKIQELTQGSSLVGKNVQYRSQDGTELLAGQVTEMFRVDETLNLLVDGNTISIDQLVGVSQ